MIVKVLWRLLLKRIKIKRAILPWIRLKLFYLLMKAMLIILLKLVMLIS
nr:MAG TPA: hypothetical protein [Caudoviricetes sp.]